jgi:hypothetical protein
MPPNAIPGWEALLELLAQEIADERLREVISETKNEGKYHERPNSR